MAKIETKRPVKQAAQLAIWESFESSKTNMVALYDLAPRFVFYIKTDTEKRKVIEREFTAVGGQRFKVTLKPTQMVQSDGTVKDCYLGEREQIVEEVIRRLASNRSRLTLHGDTAKPSVRFCFFLNEVRRELERVKHSYRLDEIRESITLLNEVRIRIESIENKRSPVLSAPAFPVMGMRKREDEGDDRESWIEFNPLVADAIRTLGFQQVDYDMVMEIRDPTARWLFKRIWMEMSEKNDPMLQMTATEIRVNSGMPEWKATRNMLRRVKAAVQMLKDKGMLDVLDEEEHKSGQRKDDITFTMTASAKLMSQVRNSRKLADTNVVDFKKVSGGREPDEFVFVSGTDLQRIRDTQRRKTLALVSEVEEATAAE